MLPLLQKIEQQAIDKAELEAALMALGGLLAIFFALFLVALRLAIHWRPKNRIGGDLEMGALMVNIPAPPPSDSSSLFLDAREEEEELEEDDDANFEMDIRNRLRRLRGQDEDEVVGPAVDFLTV